MDFNNLKINDGEILVDFNKLKEELFIGNYVNGKKVKSIKNLEWEPETDIIKFEDGTSKIYSGERIKISTNEHNARVYKLKSYHEKTEDGTHCIDGIFAHGKLWDVLNHDCLQVPYIEFNNGYKFHFMEGIHEVLISHQGDEIPAIMYYWKIGDRNRGLVVLPDDELGNKEARSHYIKKGKIL